MIFGGPHPWQNHRQRQLLRACFHLDSDKALKIATRWFANYAFEDVTYVEHRHLIRLRARFPDLPLAPNIAKRIDGLKRQLWVRANLNLKTAMPDLAALGEFGIPWVLTGTAQWFVQPKFAKQETADIIEFTVPENAISATLHLLKEKGWKPGYASPIASAGPVFTLLSKTHGTLKLSHPKPLFYYTPDALEPLWANRKTCTHSAGDIYIPTADAAFSMALARSHKRYRNDDQWIADIFNLSSDPLAFLAARPMAQSKKMRAVIKTNF